MLTVYDQRLMKGHTYLKWKGRFLARKESPAKQSGM